jgi:phage head maturation protease
MLVCGQVNPPPVSSENYHGVFFSDKDDLEGKAKGLKGTPLRVEHNHGVHVGKVLNGWTDAKGAMWALAEIETNHIKGAMTAAAVERGQLGEFSLGYVTQMSRASNGGVNVNGKRIIELSIVKKGARDGCRIEAHHDEQQCGKKKARTSSL